MKKYIILIILIVTITGIFFIKNNSCYSLHNNVYQYRFSDDTPISETFTIIFKCNKNNLEGIILGAEPEGEHGIAYYKQSLSNINVQDKEIYFEVVYKDLFKLPFLLENYLYDFKNDQIGFSKYKELYSGIIKDNIIEVSCKSDFYSCYSEEKMVFKITN